AKAPAGWGPRLRGAERCGGGPFLSAESATRRNSRGPLCHAARQRRASPAPARDGIVVPLCAGRKQDSGCGVEHVGRISPLVERPPAEAVRFFRSASLRLTHGYVLAEFVALAQARGLPRQPFSGLEER